MIFRLCAAVGVELSLHLGGWGHRLASLGARRRRLRQGAGPERSCWRQASSPGGVPGAGLAAGAEPGLFFGAAGGVGKRRGLGQPGCGEAAARGASGAGGSGARSEDAARRQANPRSHQPGVSALGFEIDLTRVYPPPFFFLNIFFFKKNQNRILFSF